MSCAAPDPGRPAPPPPPPPPPPRAPTALAAAPGAGGPHSPSRGTRTFHDLLQRLFVAVHGGGERRQSAAAVPGAGAPRPASGILPGVGLAPPRRPRTKWGGGSCRLRPSGCSAGARGRAGAVWHHVRYRGNQPAQRWSSSAFRAVHPSVR